MKNQWKGYTLEELKTKRVYAEVEIIIKRNEFMERIHSGVNSVTKVTPMGVANMFIGSAYSPINLIKYFMMGWNMFKNAKRIINMILKRKAKDKVV